MNGLRKTRWRGASLSQAKASALVADGVRPSPKRLEDEGRLASAALILGGSLYSRPQGVARKKVFQVRQDEFLVLLFVMQAQFDDGQDRVERSAGAALKDAGHEFVDGAAVIVNLGHGWARDQAALRTGVHDSGRSIIEIKKIMVLGFQRLMMRSAATMSKRSKNHDVCARCHLVGLAFWPSAGRHSLRYSPPA